MTKSTGSVLSAGMLISTVTIPDSATAAITNIRLGDFANPIVVDFTSATPGAISGNDLIFTSAGIAGATVSGGVGSDTYNANTGTGRDSASVGGALSIIDPFDALDDGSAPSSLQFAFDFASDITRFGFNILD